MAIPNYQSLMLPVLKKSAVGEVRIGDVVEELAQDLNLTPDDRSLLLPSGKQTVLANRVHWAKTYLKQAGLVESSRRAYFRISDRGRSVLATNPEAIDNETLSRFNEFNDFLHRRREIDDTVAVAPDTAISKPRTPSGEGETPDEIMRAAQEQIHSALRQDLIDRIMGAPPEFFERLIVSLLLAMGYGGATEEAGKTIGRSGDDGVDGVIDQDPLGLDRVYIQAKRYQSENKVGPGAIRDFFGSLDMHKASKGMFVTTSGFSSAATETAAKLGKRIVLIQGSELAQLMIKYNVECKVEETLEIKKIDEDFFE